jgi:hypothetical protein
MAQPRQRARDRSRRPRAPRPLEGQLPRDLRGILQPRGARRDAGGARPQARAKLLRALDVCEGDATRATARTGRRGARGGADCACGGAGAEHGSGGLGLGEGSAGKKAMDASATYTDLMVEVRFSIYLDLPI